MTHAPDDLAARLHRRLVEAAAARPAEAGALTVGEVYHELIPYRGVRGELGVFELAAYEHALLRLLAGEAGPVRVLDAAARAEFAAELGSPNPILGIYRDYASLEVTVGADGGRDLTDPMVEARRTPLPTPGDVTQEGPPPPPAAAPPAQAPPPGGASAPRPHLPDHRPAAPADATRVASPRVSPPSPAPDRAGAPGDCLDCGASLPDVEGLRFCPHCGGDQSRAPCDRCSTPLRADWKFCIRCGARRSTD